LSDHDSLLARVRLLGDGKAAKTPQVWRLGIQVEDVFRNANERIAEKARELRMEPPIPFLCECSDRRCFAGVLLTIAEYDEERAAPERYVTIAGHEVEGRS
jgi:hypothetical protein